MTDWGSAYNSGGSSGGGTDWGSFYGGGSRSTGGGVPLSGGSGGGGLLGLVENLGHDVTSTITNAPRGIISIAHQAAHTLGPSGVTENIFAKNPTGVHWLDQILNAGRNEHKKNFSQDTAGIGGGTLVPFVKQERHIYGSALHGNFHPLYQHPLQPLLDLATVATGGGALAAKAAEAGKLGETAAGVARAERVLKSGDLAEPLNKARTLQGRYLQQKFDQLSMSPRFEDTPIIGANPRLAKITEIRNYRQTIRAGMPAREFQQATKGLTKDEKFAFHVGAEGVPLADRITFYRKEFRDNPTPQLRDYLHRLESPKVADVLENPSAKLTAALHEGHALQETATQRLIDAGQLARETHADRSIMPQQIMRPGQPIPLRGSLVHPDFPTAFRFPHTGEEAAKPGLFTSPSGTAALRPPRTPGFLRRSEAVRLRTARLMTNPEVLTKDYLATMRHEHLNSYRSDVLRPVSKPLAQSLERTGGKGLNESYFMEKPSQRLPRDVRERATMSQDLAMTDAKGAETALGARAKDTVFGANDMPAELRGKSIDQLNEMGVRRIPTAFAKRYNANFASTGRMMRLFWDRPLDVWRMMTLNLRPAWMVNNLVGNAVQYALRYAGANGMAAYLQALLQTERGADKVIQIRNWTRTVPTLQRKVGRIINEVAPEVHGTGAYSTFSRVTKGGAYQGSIDRLEATKVARAVSLPTHILLTAVKAIPRGITAFERTFAEAVPREAAFLMEMRPVIQKLGLAHSSLEDALKAIAEGKDGRRHIELAIDRSNDYMGDFNSMNPTERRWVKRAIPFEAWYRVILQVSGKYALHYPGRVNLLFNIGKVYQADNKTLPSWLQGAIKIGMEKSGIQTMLTTMGLNPYETIPQLTQQNPTGVLNPVLQAAMTGGTGVDPFTMGAYRGPGAAKGNSPADFGSRFVGSLYSGLVPARLYGQLSGPSQSTLYQPKTYGHVGPVPINDYLLQYLGLPIRHVNRQVAAQYAAEGR